MRVIYKPLPSECFRAEPRTLTVETVVIHSMSAIFWDRRSPEEIDRIERAAFDLPSVEATERKHYAACCRALLVAAKLFYHYPIGRDG